MKLAIAVIVAALAGSAAPKPAVDPHKDVRELAGHTMGKTQRCVAFDPGKLFEVSASDPHVLLYERGKTIWATRVDDACSFEPGQTAVPDSNASYYCSGDLVRSGGRMVLTPFAGLCKIGNFTAYSTK